METAAPPAAEPFVNEIANLANPADPQPNTLESVFANADKALASLTLSTGFYIILALIIIIIIIFINRNICKRGCGHFGRRCGCPCCEGMTSREYYEEHAYNPATNAFGWIHPGAQNTPSPIMVTPMIMQNSALNNTRRVTLHYTNWCGACKRMKPVWNQVKVAAKNSGIIFEEIDEDVARTPGISGYPTIIMLNERGERGQYNGGPDFDTLRNWVVNPVQQSI